MRLSEWLYNGLIHLGLPLAVGGYYYSFRDRDPYYQTGMKFSLPDQAFLKDEVEFWIHGASVGEAGVINQVLELYRDLGVPDRHIVVSTQTKSGLESVEHNRCFLLPADYPQLIQPLTDRIDPTALLVVETELWPNLFRYNSGRTILLNARISDRAREYYRLIRSLTAATLDHARAIYTRTQRDANRFEELGADSNKIHPLGDLKWIRALDPPDETIESPWKDTDRIVTVGSTHPGEEKLLLEPLLASNYKINLAPRHLDRLNDVKALLDGMDVSWVPWSDQSSDQSDDIDVMLVDEFGLLEALFRQSALGVIGGSWTTEGGHNLLEAAQYGIPVITGPNLQNFRGMADLLDDTGLLHIVEAHDIPDFFTTETMESLRDNQDGNRELIETIKPVRDGYSRVLGQTLDPAEAPGHQG